MAHKQQRGSIVGFVVVGALLAIVLIGGVFFVKNNAISAGSYISLCADKIYMKPFSSIGDAALRTITGNEADPKITSYWIEKMSTAANHNGKNVEVVVAMVDPSIEITGLTEKGQLVTLSADQALEYGIADGLVNSIEEIIIAQGYESAVIERIDLTVAENRPL